MVSKTLFTLCTLDIHETVYLHYKQLVTPSGSQGGIVWPLSPYDPYRLLNKDCNVKITPEIAFSIWN